MNVTMDPIGSRVGAPQFTNHKMAVMRINNVFSDIENHSDHNILFVFIQGQHSASALCLLTSVKRLSNGIIITIYGLGFWSK